MSVLNELIREIIKDEYIIKERTDDEKLEYHDELKNQLFNDYLYHHDADDINMDKYMKIFKTLYYFYKESYDMGDNIIDALDDKQKLFNLYALMVFDEIIDDVINDLEIQQPNELIQLIKNEDGKTEYVFIN